MREIFLVGAGSFIGGIARYLLSGWVVHSWVFLRFPLGTFAVNCIGCFLIGIVSGIAEHRHVIPQEMRLFLITGVLGGFTTFSAFGYETVTLMRVGAIYLGILNIALSLVVCLLAVWMGIRIGVTLSPP